MLLLIGIGLLPRFQCFLWGSEPTPPFRPKSHSDQQSSSLFTSRSVLGQSFASLFLVSPNNCPFLRDSCGSEGRCKVLNILNYITVSLPEQVRSAAAVESVAERSGPAHLAAQLKATGAFVLVHGQCGTRWWAAAGSGEAGPDANNSSRHTRACRRSQPQCHLARAAVQQQQVQQQKCCEVRLQSWMCADLARALTHSTQGRQDAAPPDRPVQLQAPC